MADENKLEKLKEKYETIRRKHGLPEFKELNEDFQVDKISEAETEILIREVRKHMSDKIFNYMRFIEGLLNPVNAPMFTLSIVKLLGPEERKKLGDIYKEMMKSEVVFIRLDLEFSEVGEAKFIKDSFKLWQGIKKDLVGILDKIDAKWDNKAEVDSKGYFG